MMPGNKLITLCRLPFVRGEKKIVGENSTKMYGIIRALIELEESHKGEKILIFSEVYPSRLGFRSFWFCFSA